MVEGPGVPPGEHSPGPLDGSPPFSPIDSPLDWRVHGWVVGGAQAPLAIPQTITNPENHHGLHLFHSPYPAHHLALWLWVLQHLLLRRRRKLRLRVHLRRRAQRPVT